MPNIGFIGAAANCAAPAIAPQAQQQVQAQAAAAVDVCRQLSGLGLDNGIEPPGSKEFCAQIPAIQRALEGIYDTLNHWLIEVDAVDVIISHLKFEQPAEIVGSITGSFKALWNAIVDLLTASIRWQSDLTLKVVREMRDLYQCIHKRCDSKALLGLWIIKVVMSLVEDMQLGLDPGVWAVVKISIKFDKLREYISMLERYFCPTEPPTAEQATAAYLQDLIGRDRRDCIWRLNGHAPSVYETYALTERERLDWREAVQYARRLNLGADAESKFIRERGFVDSEDVDMAREMYWELPGIADHLHWLTRNVDDADYVQQYGLLDGFAPDNTIRTIPKFSTYTTVVDPGQRNFWATYGKDLTALGMRIENAAYHYAAHWIQPSPQQMQEFVYRSDEIEQFTGRPFTVNDYMRILAEQDYSPISRKWFAATVYQVPAISYVKEWYRQDIINRDQLESYHRRLGFSPDDARSFADIDDIQKRRMRTAATHGWTPAAINKAFALEQIDRTEHNQRFADLGYTPEEALHAQNVALLELDGKIATRARSRALTVIATTVTQGLDVGVLDTSTASAMMQQAGWPKQFADSFVSVENALAGIKVVRQGISYLRRRVLDGSIDFPTAAAELQRFGLTSPAIQRNLAVWRLSMTPRRKHRTASNIVNDLAQGHMTQPQAMVRLANLGYDNADSMLFLADAQAKVTKLNQQRLAAANKAGTARAKALATAHKDAQKAAKAALQSLMREAPVATLKKWAKLGLIGHDTFIERMELYGFGRVDAETYYKEACKAKGSACVAGSPKQTPFVSDGGSGGTATPGSGGSAG
jgi:hypothetical protein